MAEIAGFDAAVLRHVDEGVNGAVSARRSQRSGGCCLWGASS